MSRRLPFTKLHGAGNDFVLLDGVAHTLPDVAPIARFLADRHFGIGCDQVLVVRRSSSADFRMEIYNADGSQVEMCGNGIRAFYLYLRNHGHTRKEKLSVETLGGIVHPRWAGEGRVTVDMGRPILAPEKIPTTLGNTTPLLDVPLRVEGETFRLSCVSMGNPHAVIFVDGGLDAFPVERFGPRIENHEAFPNRVNVEFVERIDRSHLRQRTWERGTGESLACGSGACAVSVAAILRGVAERELRIELRGGTLEMSWPTDDASVFMTGPAVEVFSGEIAIEGES
jgi:diaminopimelate epimerase